MECLHNNHIHRCMCWKCEGHASHEPMQPTNKYLRSSLVHKVSNNMTHLSFSRKIQMHNNMTRLSIIVVLWNRFTHCKMTNDCSTMFLCHDWVTPSRICLLWFILTSPMSSTYLLSRYVWILWAPFLSLVWMLKHDARSGCRVYIGDLTHGRFPWILDFIHGLVMQVLSITIGYVTCSYSIVVNLFSW